MTLALAVLLATSAQVAAATAPSPARDVHSLGRPELARPTHVSLDLTLDYERKFRQYAPDRG